MKAHNEAVLNLHDNMAAVFQRAHTPSDQEVQGLLGAPSLHTAGNRSALEAVHLFHAHTDCDLKSVPEENCNPIHGSDGNPLNPNGRTLEGRSMADAVNRDKNHVEDDYEDHETTRTEGHTADDDLVCTEVYSANQGMALRGTAAVGMAADKNFRDMDAIDLQNRLLVQ